MIHVTIDASAATPEELAFFFALQGVARAVDSMAHAGGPAGVQLQLRTPQDALQIDPPLDLRH